MPMQLNVPVDVADVMQAALNAHGVNACAEPLPRDLGSNLPLTLAQPMGAGGRTDVVVDQFAIRFYTWDVDEQSALESSRAALAHLLLTVGEQVDGSLFQASGVDLDGKGRPVVNADLMTTVRGIYAAGDGRRGPATVVKAIADAITITKAITGVSFDRYATANEELPAERALAKKGELKDAACPAADDRCLGCPKICEVCADVCPNRANVVISVPGMEMPQILHVDGMCNECGNCAVFCPWSGRPYKDKFTLFWSEEDFADSENSGFLMIDEGTARVRLFGQAADYDICRDDCGLPEGILALIRTVKADYGYLL